MLFVLVEHPKTSKIPKTSKDLSNICYYFTSGGEANGENKVLGTCGL